MEGPGGYQFIGRTLQMWNTFRSTSDFPPGKPWLLRFFDQVRFHPVSAAELLEIRDSFPRGRYSPRIESREFRLRDYHSFLDSIQPAAEAFKAHQQQAFEAERERWAETSQETYLEPPEPLAMSEADSRMPEGCRAVRSPIAASVWNVAVQPGQKVDAGQKLIVLESMKMEIVVAAPSSGVIEKVSCDKGALVLAGQVLVALRVEAGV
jgi:urea carboxylase